MRINVRLDEQSEQDLQLIQQTTGETVTQIIKELLAERAEQLREKNKPGAKLKALLESDFVGCVKARKTVRSTIKNMSRTILMKNTLIADTGYFAALANSKDAYHQHAIRVSQTLQYDLITT